MKRTHLRCLCAFTLLIVLTSCGRAPSSLPATERPVAGGNYGFVEIIFDMIGTDAVTSSAQFVTPTGLSTQATIADGIQLEQVVAGNFDLGVRGDGGMRYLYATYRVRNATQSGDPYSDPVTNLTFVAVDTEGDTVGDTAIRRLEDFDRQAIDNADLARQILSTHRMRYAHPNLQVVDNEADFQAFSEEDLVGLLGDVAYNPLPYGFVVRCIDNCTDGRTLAADPGEEQFDGLVTFAVKVPLQTGKDPFRISLWMQAIADPVRRVTESVEEQPGSTVGARATAVRAEQVTLLGNSLTPVAHGRRLCQVRSAGLIDSVSAYLVNEPGCEVLDRPIYVNGNRDGSDKGDGESWDTAFRYLTDALSAAREERLKEIWVAAGTYLPTEGDAVVDHNGNATGNSSRTATFYVTEGIELYGGFAGHEATLAERDLDENTTTLSGAIGVSENTGSFHVVWLDGSVEPVTGATVIDGVTITGGEATGAAFPHERGGGLFCNGRTTGNACSPRIQNVVFHQNRAVALGANASSYGGAVYNDGSHGGKSSPVFTAVEFRENEAFASGASTSSYGGAVYNDGSHGGKSSPVFTAVEFRNNRASASGAGASSYGGAVYNAAGDGASPTFINTIFRSNSASSGGAVYNVSVGDITFLNVTFSGHASSVMHNEGDVDSTFINSILWDNASLISGSGGSPSFSHSIVQGSGGSEGGWNGPGTDEGGNLDDDPKFVDADAGNLRLCTASPAIDAGTTDPYDPGGVAERITTDLDGNPRIDGGQINMGPYQSSEACNG